VPKAGLEVVDQPDSGLSTPASLIDRLFGMRRVAETHGAIVFDYYI